MIEIANIKYDLDGTQGYEEYYQNAVCEGLTREQMLEKLPSTMSVDNSNIDIHQGSLGIQLQELIESTTGWICLGFSYKVTTDQFGLIEETFEEPPLKEQMKELEEEMLGGA